MTDAVLSQVACIAFKNDAILENVHMADVRPALRNFNFLEKTRKQNIRKRNMEVSLHWFSKIPIREGV